MTPPKDRKYTAMHEWLLLDGDVATVGITAYAADALGDVVYVQAPVVDAQVTAGEVCGEIESTKSVSDLFAPADGTVLEVNQEIVDDPGAVNTDPYGAGWLFRLHCSSLPDLLDADAYVDLIDNGA